MDRRPERSSYLCTGPEATTGKTAPPPSAPAPRAHADDSGAPLAVEAPPAADRRAADFPLTLTRALLETLDLRRILYVILTGATAGDGLGFNRALLWLEDEGGRALRGQLAIGPRCRAEASRIWEAMEAEQFDLERVMRLYDAFQSDHHASRLARQVARISWPLPLPDAEPSTGSEEEFPALLGRVLREGRAQILNDPPMLLPGTDIQLHRLALAPLLHGGHAVGALVVDNAFNEQPVVPAQLHDLQTLANLAAVAVERARLYERLRRMADIDGLTGLLNRRRFDELLAELILDSRRHDEPLSMLMIDVDEFKSVNDEHGHLAGDDVLRGLADIVGSRIRQGDLAARYGGDEMAVLLPRATGPEALEIGRYLCETVRRRGFGAGRDLAVTISVGVAELQDDHRRPAHLLAAADAALYRAKGRGRDSAVL